MCRYPQLHAPHRFARIDGFTLLEVLITLAVAAILLGIAVPSYRSVVARNSIAANVNDFVAGLNFSRSEAVTRGRKIQICSSGNQQTCSGTPDWSNGWVIYVDDGTSDPKPTDETRLRVKGPSGSGFTITTTSAKSLSFNSNGFAEVGATFTAASDASSTQTIIRVAATGRVETESTR